MKTLILILSLLASGHARAEEPPALSATLDMSWVLRQVATRNPELRAAQADVEMAENDALMAYAWMPPRLQLEWMGMNWPSPDLGMAMSRRTSISQELPFPGRTWLKGRVATHAAARVAAMRRMDMERKLADAREAWYQMAGAEWVLKALRSTREATQEMTRLSSRRGNFGQLDRMGQFMNTMLAMEDSDLESMEPMWIQQRRMAESRLNRLMGAPADRPLPPAQVDLDALLAEPAPKLEELKETMLANNPELEDAKHHLIHAQAKRRLAYSGWLPDLMVSGSMTETAGGMSESGAMLGFSLPWIWFWGQAGEVGAASAELEHARASVEAARSKLSEDSRVALGEWEASREALRATWKGTLPRAEQGLKLGLAGFRTGSLGPSEILMAVQDYRMAHEKMGGLIEGYGKSKAMLEMIRATASAEGAPKMEMSHE